MNRLTGKNLYLIGFMATGKSRVGRELARLLKWPFVDTDQWVEQTAGRRISEIFSLQGETAFRDLESAAIRKIVNRRHQVISLGGGAVLREENWQAIAASGITVCLTATLQTILQRVQRKNNRPLLNNETRETLQEKIKGMLDQRWPQYQRADYFFESREQVSAHELALKIYHRLLET